MAEFVPILEKVYDRYSHIVYGIAIEISLSEADAERVLVRTFEKLCNGGLNLQNHSSLPSVLIKLTVETACELLPPDMRKNNFKMKGLERFPLIHQFLFENNSIEACCLHGMMTRAEAAKKI